MRVILAVLLATAAVAAAGDAHFLITKSSAKQPFSFTCIAPNHEKLGQSENYNNLADAESAIQALQKWGKQTKDDPKGLRAEVLASKGEKHYFVIKSGNNKIIFKSEIYASKSNANRGVEDLKKNVAKTVKRAPRAFVQKSDNAKKQQYYFSVVAANYEKQGQSEMYTDAAGAKNGIKSLVEWAKGTTPAEVKAAKGGHTFSIKAANNKIILHGEVYTTKEAAEKGWQALRANFKTATIDADGTATGATGGNAPVQQQTAPAKTKFRAILAHIMHEAAELEEMVA